ncbi:MAG TPA: hypothetical protein VIJ50_03325, partial [Solirubrobacteraceae bacterium]
LERPTYPERTRAPDLPKRTRAPDLPRADSSALTFPSGLECLTLTPSGRQALRLLEPAAAAFTP